MSETNLENSREERMIDTYYDKIDALVEVDYGDFKRKAGHYLIRLQDSLSTKQNPAIRQTITDLRMQIVHSPKQDVEATREKLLAGLDLLRKFIR